MSLTLYEAWLNNVKPCIEIAVLYLYCLQVVRFLAAPFSGIRVTKGIHTLST
jgi:hypothetical protein